MHHQTPLPARPMPRSIALALALASSVAAAAPALAQPTASTHQLDAARHAADPVHPDHLAGPAHVLRGTTPRPCRTVMGFLPYWVSPSSVRWNQLTHVACFDVRASASGTVSNPISWPWTSTIATARANNVKVLLTVSSFDPAINSAIVNSTTARANFATSLANLIRNTADGVVLDLEGVNPAAPAAPWQNQMVGFVNDLRTRLNQQLVGSAYPAPLIYVATPAWNWAGAASGWNFAALAQASDGLFIMGYDYNGSWTGASGPSSPLTGNSGINVTGTLTSQYAAARSAAGAKLILGVPYYGNQWQTATSAAFSSANAYTGSVLFSTAQAQQLTFGRQWDTTTQTPWYRFQTGSPATWSQVWYDDAQSLRAKFRLAKQQSLGGVGMWALTYDASRPELADVIASEFIAPCACRADVDLSGLRNVEDIFIFLGRWFADCSPAQPGSPCFGSAADFDGSGTRTVEDIFMFLSAWFAGC